MATGPTDQSLAALIDHLKCDYMSRICRRGLALHVGPTTDAERAQFIAEWQRIRDWQPLTPIDDATRVQPDVEGTVADVLDILTKDRAGKAAAEQIKDAAEQSIRRQASGEALGRAIRNRQT